MGTSERSAGAGLGHDERRSLRDGLALLDYADPGLADRAARFVLDGTGTDVLLELGARPAGELSVLLGEPGRLTDRRHHDAMWWEINETLKARARLYRALPAGGVPAAVLDALVRLGRVLEAADAGHSLDDPGAGAPRWLQYLVNDALVAAPCGNGSWDRSQVPSVVDVVLVAALLACDGSYDPGLALRVGFERAGIAGDLSFRSHFLDPLVRTVGAARFLGDHHEQVDGLPGRLSGSGRALLAHRVGGDPELLPEFAELMVALAVDPDPQVHEAASPYLDRLPEPRRVEVLLAVLAGGDAGRRREAVGLLARCAPATVLAPLHAAAAHEPNERVRHALTTAVDRLEGRPVEPPAPPPCAPIPDPPLGAAAVAVLARHRDALREQARDGVTEAAEAMRAAGGPGHDHARACQRRDGLEALFDDDLWAVVHVLEGRPGAEMPGAAKAGGHQTLLVRAVHEVIRAAGRGGELTVLPGWSGAHLVRWVALTRDPRRRRSLWEDWRFQAWLAGGPEQSVDLRAIARLQVPGVADPDTVAREALWSGRVPLHDLRADHVWPFFAEHPEYVDQCLGLVPRPDSDPAHGSGPGGGHSGVVHLLLTVLGTFPALQPRWIPPLLELAFDGTKAPRRRARTVLAKQPDAVRYATGLLSHPTAAVRTETAVWLGRLGRGEAVAPLTAALATERQEAVRAGLLTALEALGADLSAHLSPEVLGADAAKGLTAKVPATLSWFPFEALPACRWTDGTEVAGEVVRWWVVLGAKLKDPGNALLTRYVGLLDDASRAALGELVLRRFIAQDELGTAIAAKGVLALASGAPGPVAVRLLGAYLRDHHRRRAQCEALLDAFVATDDLQVVQFLLGVSRRFRAPTVQQRALEIVTAIARRKGWTEDELADRTVPAAGLDETGTLTLSFGPRAFTVTLDAALKPRLRTAEGTPVKALPAAHADDDPDLVKEAKQQLSAHRAELRQVVEQQTARLYEAMCTDRTWPVDEWRRHLVAHPVVGRMAQRLVWLDLDPTHPGPPRGVRPGADGLVDVDGGPLELADATTVRLAHGTLLRPPDRSRWIAHLADHGVVPLFDQLTHLRPDLPARDDAIDDRQGWVGDTFGLRTAFTRRGYRRGDAEYDAFFYRYTKDLPALGLQVVVGFSGNLLPEENRPAALTTLTFEQLPARPGRHVPVGLADVPLVVLAEAYADYHAVAAACGVFDPDWEKIVPW